MEPHAINFEVFGWGSRRGFGTAEVVHYSLGWRFARSLKALALIWAIAIPLMFIPYAMVVVFPAAFGLSLFFVVQHMRAPDVTTTCSGTCPDCEHTQQFDPPERFELPLEIQCGNCHRELWLRECVTTSAAAT